MTEATASKMLRARLLLGVVGQALVRQGETEWFGSPMHRLAIARPAARAFALRPRDNRPIDTARGRQVLGGAFTLGGAVLNLGPDGDPFDRPSPSRRFAVSLHRFGWMADLVSVGEDGLRRALALQADWRRSFGRWNGFSWGGETLERRVFNLACAAPAMATWRPTPKSPSLRRISRGKRGICSISRPTRLARRNAPLSPLSQAARLRARPASA